jgi:NIPSNAP
MVAQAKEHAVAAVIEVRTYKIRPGQRDEIMGLLRDRLFPLHREIGIRVLGLFPSAEDQDTFTWLRAFPDADSRDAMCKTLYGGAEWKDELQELIVPAITEHNVAVLEDAPGLWDCWPELGA